MMSHQYTPIKTAKIKILTIPNVGEYVENLDLSSTAGENINVSAGPFLKNTFKKKPLTHDPAIALLGIYSREMKTYIITNTCT